MVGMYLMSVNYQVHFQIGCIILPSYWHCMRTPGPPALPQNLI